LALLRTIRAAGALALAFAAATGCGGGEAEGGPQGAVVDTVHVRAEDVASLVQAVGTVEADNQTAVAGRCGDRSPGSCRRGERASPPASRSSDRPGPLRVRGPVRGGRPGASPGAALGRREAAGALRSAPRGRGGRPADIRQPPGPGRERTGRGPAGSRGCRHRPVDPRQVHGPRAVRGDGGEAPRRARPGRGHAGRAVRPGRRPTSQDPIRGSRGPRRQDRGRRPRRVPRPLRHRGRADRGRGLREPGDRSREPHVRSDGRVHEPRSGRPARGLRRRVGDDGRARERAGRARGGLVTEGTKNYLCPEDSTAHRREVEAGVRIEGRSRSRRSRRSERWRSRPGRAAGRGGGVPSRATLQRRTDR
jgi:hypothetical protein